MKVGRVGNGTILPYDGKEPKIADTAYICQGAYVIGDVEIGEYTVVHPGVVLRGDGGKLKIGSWCLFQDNCVVHCNWRGIDVVIGDHVNVSLSANVHAYAVGDATFIGGGATVVNGVYLGNRCFVAAGAVVPEGLRVPDGSLLIGVPARIKEGAAEVPLERFSRTLTLDEEDKNRRKEHIELLRRDGH